MPAWGQISPAASAPASTDSESPSALQEEFFAIVREGDALKFLSYVPEDGVNLGRDAQHTSRAEVEHQLMTKTGLYCKLFDSTCLQAEAQPDSRSPGCSYRNMLTQSEKVRTTSAETIRNDVRQAILVARVQNDKCGGAVLIDFIFNRHHDGWKLFSIP
ncbi:MAG TPA: hypothetical protein VMT56_04080 [Candidatus Bathyarchaeia archaeon]|nr:hypothetical protein [Candidatus Bathyarchaeia archaeon]